MEHQEIKNNKSKSKKRKKQIAKALTATAIAGTVAGVQPIESLADMLNNAIVFKKVGVGGNGIIRLPSGEFVVADDFTLTKYSANGTQQWQKQLSPTVQSSRKYTLKGIDLAHDGGFIVAGETDHTATGDFSGTTPRGSDDIILVKFSSTGTKQWVKRFGGTSIDTAKGVKRTSDGNYIVWGVTYSKDYDFSYRNGVNPTTNNHDTFVIKVNASGSVLWTRTFGGSGRDNTESVTETSDGGVAVVVYGSEKDYQWTGLTASNYALLKYSKDGALQWTYNFPKTVQEGDNIFEENGVITVFSVNNVYQFDLNGNILLNKAIDLGLGTTYGDLYVGKDLNGDYILTGTDVDNSLKYRSFISKYDKDFKKIYTDYFEVTGKPLSVLDGLILKDAVVDEKGVVTVIGADHDSEKYFIQYRDNKAPANATFTLSKTTPTNQDVTVTIKYPTDAYIKQYKIDSGSWMDYIAPVKMTANGTIYARSYDVAGNVSAETSVNVTNIDKTPPSTPTFSADKTTPTNGNVVVTVNYPADASVKEVRVNGGSWTTYSAPITMTANGTVEARAIDEAGNVSEIGSLTVSNIDKTPPAKATFSASTIAPTNQDVTVTISFPQDASVKEYKIGETGTWTSYSSPFTVSSNITIFARSKDDAGNLSEISSYLVNNIDKTAPNKPTLSASTTSPTNQNVTVTISYPSDASVKEYRVNNGAWTPYSSPVVLTANGTIEARAKDEAGNYSSIGSLTISNIDKTPPTQATFSPSTTSPTNGSVILTINYPSDASVKEYKIGSTGTWMPYNNPVEVISNTTVYARSKDAVGNVSAESSYTVNNIDKVAPNTPTLSASTTAPTNGNVSVTISYPSDAVVKQYRTNGGSWQAYSSAIILTQNGTVEARAIDEAGNVSEVGSLTVSNIDKTPPANATFEADKTTPTNTDVKVTIHFPADAVTKQYKIGNGQWTAYTAPITLTSNNTVYARSYDAVGNVSEETSFVVNNIDKVAPNAPTLSASTTAPTNSNVVVTVSYPADAHVKQVRVNGGEWQTYTSAITMTANGIVEARAIDQAGNISIVEKITVSNIDKTPPAKATFDPSTTAPTNQDVTVTINFPSDASVKEYKIGETGTWKTYSSPVVVTENTTIFARSKDAVGNLSEESSLVISNIDRVAPTTPTLSADKTTPTNGNVVVTVNYPADASVKEYRVNGGSWTAYTSPITLTANGTVEARAKDQAGNYSAIGSINITNIDKTPPVNPTFVASTTAPTNQDVSVTINFPADATVKQYKIGSTGSWTNYTSPIILTANNTVYARAYDEAGNASSEVSFNVSNIDKIPPYPVTITADKTAPTRENVILTVSSPDMHLTTQEYRIDGGEWQVYSSPVVMAINGKFEARSKDEAGNFSDIVAYNVTNIDKTPPVKATFSANKTTPTNTDVTVTISYPSDATVKEYKIGNGQWTAYTAPVVVSANTTIYARSKDAVGNLSEESSYVINNIDKIAPTEPTLSASTTSPTNQNVTVTISYPTDATETEYRVNGGTWSRYVNPVIMTANGTVEARAKDEAGNYSEVAIINITNIDKTPPANPTFVASTTALTNQSVSVTIHFPADATVKQYKVGSGEWKTYTAPIVLDANDTVYARAYDAVGNVSDQVNFVVSNIDKVAPNAPTVSADKTTPTNENVILTATFPSDAVVKEYRIDGGNWTPYTSPVTFAKNGKFEVRAKDQAGNYSDITVYNVTNIDKTPPQKATFTLDKTTPTNTDVTVTISYPSDADKKEYKIGETGSWTIYTSPIKISSNTTVFARSTDAVGNVSEVSSQAITNIDKVAPEKPTLVANTTSPTNGNVIVTITYPSDASIKQVRVNGGSWQSYSTAITMTENGTVEARAIDVAGNVSEIGIISISNIDKTPPVKATFVPSTTQPTNQNVSLVINYPSDASVKEYKVGINGEWKVYSSPVVITDNTTVFARSTDAVGNVSEESSYVINNIDKISPTTPTFSADITEPTNKDVKVSVTFSSDAFVKEIRINNGEWQTYSSAITFTQNGKVEARAIDQAGNVSDIAIYHVSNIDKIAPTKATFTADKTTPTNTDVKVTISYPSDASVKEYKVGENGEWKAYTTPVVVSQNDTIFARSMDAVGNVSEVSSYAITNIDKVPPQKPSLFPNITAPTNGNVIVTVTYPSDAKVKQVRINGGAWVEYTSAIVMEQNGTVEAMAIDEAGNVSEIGMINISNIDKTAPDQATFSANTTSPTNQDVVITISFPVDAHVKEYKVGEDGTWKVYTEPVSISANTTIFARSLDEIGNVSEVSSYAVTNIDKVAPTTPIFTADITEPTNTDVTVSVEFPQDAVVKEVRVNGAEWKAYTDPIVMKENGTVEARAKDIAGNYSTVGTFEVNNIDKIAPQNLTFVASETSPTNKDVTITIQFPQDATVKQFRIGSTGNWMNYTDPILLSENDTIYARAYDAVGNISEVTSYAVTNIDKEVPNAPTLSADVTEPTNTDVIVTVVYPVDAHKKEVRINNGEWVAYTSPITLSQNGKVEARAIDKAGNVSEVASYEVTNIDKVVPENATFSVDQTEVTNSNVVVTISYPDDASVKQYKVGLTGTWVDYTTPITVTENTTIFARSIDAVGNISEESSYDVTNIDKIAPNAPILSADITSPTNQNVTVTATFSSDSIVKEYRINNGTWKVYEGSIEMTDNGIVEVRAWDQAGNVSNITRYEVTNIDREAPEAPSYDVVKNKNKITLSANKKGTILYQINNGTWMEYTEPIITEDGTYTINFKVVDEAGNESEMISITETMYRDALTVAEEKTEVAEGEITQENIDMVRDLLKELPEDAPEYEELQERLNDLQAVIDAKKALEKALETKDEADVQEARDKINLLNGDNPVIIDLLDEIEQSYVEADILSLVAKETMDILTTKYEMSKVAYDALVQTYYASKYTSDFLYKYAKEKVSLVPETDQYYDLVVKQKELLEANYQDYVEDRVQTDVINKADAYLTSLEKNYSPSIAIEAQKWIDAVEDESVRAVLQARFDTAKANYEASMPTKKYQEALDFVQKAEQYRNTSYVKYAYEKVNALTDETQKAELTARLQALEAELELEKLIADATKYVEYAEKYQSHYIDKAQEKINALPDSLAEKTVLQERLDAVKGEGSTPTPPNGDDSKHIANAEKYIGYAEKTKNQSYINKAQEYINLIADETIRAELQARLDAVLSN